MLESVVEQVDVAAEPCLGQPSREMPVRRDEDGHAWQLTREHQRFVAGASEIGEHGSSVADDHDAVRDIRAAVSARQDRRMPAALEQPRRKVRDERRLAAAADGEVADADDRLAETPARFGPVGVVPAARKRHGAAIWLSVVTALSSVDAPERMDGRRAGEREERGNRIERAIACALVRLDERTRCGAEARAPHRIEQEVDERLLECLWRGDLHRRVVGEELARNLGEVRHVRAEHDRPPQAAGSRMLCPPDSTRLPPTNATVAS